ncbi:hypothetical protein [Photorhabdus bodei]|uniref:Uncharacterized protein n=1 Tax=Photorhabdus bodei TaxID=2029681 RepID=A0ABX0AIT2_9GAMM|nr:hypothetical protein [Photorhabdus bodei]NDL00203.1 hypothetical protein [Photorhabdus bodei]NDL02920.1 hypothetical protein [Photorhabdus bodei]NDL08696.1 hypothetical protein [Photorhabdus bodei]
MTGVSECSQQRGNLKDNGYRICYNFLFCIPATWYSLRLSIVLSDGRNLS